MRKTQTVYASTKTWLKQNISNSDIFYSGFTIFRRDRSDRGGGRNQNSLLQIGIGSRAATA